MNFEKLIQDAQNWIPTLVIFFVGMITIFPIKKIILERNEIDIKGSRWIRHLILICISLFFLLLLLISVPLSDSTKGQLFNLLGIATTATIALASTTFVGNAMAGLMIKAINSFRPGDFLKIDEHVGRVTEKGLFHIEIQSELKGLITFPNMYLIKNPYLVKDSKGVIVSATVSLGYDIPRSKIEDLLIKAGDKTGLKESFVHVMELGDCSVTYRVAGLLNSVKYFFSFQSDLRKNMLDLLHENRIEIVSPNFNNQRRYPLDQPFIPKTSRKVKEKEPSKSPEDFIYDKADEAQSIENIKESLKNSVDKSDMLKEEIKKNPEVAGLKDKLEKIDARVEKLRILLEKREKEQEEDR